MRDIDKTKGQLINELEEVRKYITMLEATEDGRKGAERKLQESEAHYRMLAENVTDIIWTMDMNLRFTYISPSITRLSGYTVEEAMALTLTEVLTPASLEIAIKASAEELAMEKVEQKDLYRPRVLELDHRHKDGSRVCGEVKMTFLRDPDGRAVGILGVVRDITGRRQAEEALRESEERLRSLGNALPDLAIVLDEDGRYLEIVNAEENIPYRDAERLKGRLLREVLPKEVASLSLKTLRQTIETGKTQSMEYLLDVPEGRRWFEGRMSPMHPTPGSKRVVVMMSRDITKRKQAEEALRESNKGA